jgi:Mn2+/Fe2+ NRAMP family transporter
MWTAPVTFTMMVAIVYLSSKLGQVAGKGLFDVIRDHYPRWVLQSALMTGNRAIMGDAVNGRGITIFGWTTTAAIFAATTGLVCTWFL